MLAIGRTKEVTVGAITARYKEKIVVFGWIECRKDRVLAWIINRPRRKTFLLVRIITGDTLDVGVTNGSIELQAILHGRIGLQQHVCAEAVPIDA
jgi:hypothetical protein